MTNKEILDKAIQKAVDGGWDKTNAMFLRDLANNQGVYWGWVKQGFIYDHSFAKALWGEPWAYFTEGQSGDTISGNFVNWKGHLANMVISEDPIKYLGSNM